MPAIQGTRVALRYKGPDVESGTMPADDVISALQGLAGAYSKIAAQCDPETEHQLRVVAIKTSSFELAIGAAVLVVASDPKSQLKTVEIVQKATTWIVKTIGLLIEAKRVSKGKPIEIKVDGKHNTVLVIGADNGGTVKLDPDQFKILDSKLTDDDLDRIVAPLKPNGVDRVELTVPNEETPVAAIDSREREYFRKEETIVTTTKETEIDGNLVSLNKENNRGTFRLIDGRSIPYHYTGSDPFRFHRDFAQQGRVRVSCTASLDQSLNPKRLDITSVEHLQGSLLPPSDVQIDQNGSMPSPSD
jgi:hypothetical protein